MERNKVNGCIICSTIFLQYNLFEACLRDVESLAMFATQFLGLNGFY